MNLVTPPSGSYPAGTPLRVGNQRLVIDRFLAEGGFAHVYVVQLYGPNEVFPPPPQNPQQPQPLQPDRPLAVLKRIACSDEEALVDFQNEIRFMKLLSGHKNIVQYLDSSVSTLKHGGFEVLILMEYCRGGHLVDFLNTRLSTRLAEPEVLQIFSDICAALAHMHVSSVRPIIHRDIKIENVLISIPYDPAAAAAAAANAMMAAGSGLPPPPPPVVNMGLMTFKLCDFGSATEKVVPAGTMLGVKEVHALEEEVNRVTTLQYRAPEMLDLFSRKGINEKVDVWALGVFLYKLCYYTTPFEDSGKLAILNAHYTMPDYPPYSQNMKQLISWILAFRSFSYA